MKRREVLKRAGQLSLGAVVAPGLLQSVSAEEVKIERFAMEWDISFNHGHAVDLDTVQVISLLRGLPASEDGETSEVEIEIQGRSGHGHPLKLNRDNLVALLESDEALELVSEVGAGHTHNVTLRLKDSMIQE